MQRRWLSFLSELSRSAVHANKCHDLATNRNLRLETEHANTQKRLWQSTSIYSSRGCHTATDNHSFTIVDRRVSLNHSRQIIKWWQYQLCSKSMKILAWGQKTCVNQSLAQWSELENEGKSLCSCCCFWKATALIWSLSSFVASGHQLKFNLQLHPSVKWGNDQRSVVYIWMSSSSDYMNHCHCRAQAAEVVLEIQYLLDRNQDCTNTTLVIINTARHSFHSLAKSLPSFESRTITHIVWDRLDHILEVRL